MATMTATILKQPGSQSKSSVSVLDAFHHPQLNHSVGGGHPSNHYTSNAAFPFLASYKSSAVAEVRPSFFDSKVAPGLNPTDAFILKSNLILRSSSLYGNSNYSSRTLPSQKQSPPPPPFAHPDFVDAAAMIATPAELSVIANHPLPRVDIGRVTRPENGGSNKSQQENVPEKRPFRRQLERLSPEEMQQLSRLLLKHFTNRRNSNDSLVHDPVPVDYNEEDPQTWPSNWLSQAPAMILNPDQYLASKPMLNAYQRQLIRRISVKYEPLVGHYLQQLLTLGEEARKFKIAEDSLSGTSLVGRLGKSRSQQKLAPSIVKSASLSSGLSSQGGRASESINSSPMYNGRTDQQKQQQHNVDLGYCDKEAGTRLSSTGAGGVKPEKNGASTTVRASSRQSHDDNNGRSQQQGNKQSGATDLRQASLDASSPTTNPAASLSSSRFPAKVPSSPASNTAAGGDRENRLTRLSQQMATKWSSKMKTYLRKN